MPLAFICTDAVGDRAIGHKLDAKYIRMLVCSKNSACS